jgi:hypothetical protein
MSSLIHATITVSGDASLLEACDARIKVLLAEQPFEGELSEHHGAGTLCYDLKLTGGIPFPAFATASREFPALTIAAEWIDVDAGARGAATLVDGTLTAHNIDELKAEGRSARPIYIAVAGNGRLELALTCFRSGRDEWLGYALTADRDALWRLTRRPDEDGFELSATEGSAEWSRRWQGSSSRLEFDYESVSAAQPIDRAVYQELEQIAQRFVADWIWFSSGRREEIAIEMERYSRYGYTVFDANVRSARLHKMRSEAAGVPGQLEFSTLGDDEAWIKDVISRCWAEPKP